jgi:D-hydroxyproline dehydrogenase subunit beta
VWTGARVEGFTGDGAVVRGVALASGEELAADLVVTCAGRWTGELLEAAGVEIPMTDPEPAGSPAVGLLVTTTPVLARLRHVIYAEGLMIRPDGAGRLMLHGDPQDARVRHDSPTSPPPAPAHELVAQLRTMLRGTDTAAIETARIGIRSLPADRMPVVGAVRNGLYVVATHSGITLSPLLGELVAEELVHDRQQAVLERFRPARFERTVA